MLELLIIIALGLVAGYIAQVIISLSEMDAGLINTKKEFWERLNPLWMYKSFINGIIKSYKELK